MNLVCASTNMTKYRKPSEDNIGAGLQTSLKISSKKVEVL
jgi:hypothetical protein